MRQIDVARILGAERPLQADRLFAHNPELTFLRVMRHAERGCCKRHDEERAAARRKKEAGFAHGEPRW